MLWYLLVSVLTASDCLAASALALSLRQAIDIAQKETHAKTAVSRLEVEIAQQDLEGVYGTFNAPRFKLESSTGLVSAAKGDITTTSDTNDNYGDIGPYLKMDLKVIQPIYSFGKYARAKEAGQSNLAMKEALFRASKDDLTLEVTKAFLGVIAGRNGTEVSKELREKYTQLLKQIEKNLQQPDTKLDDSDLLEARSLHFEIEKQCSSVAANTEQSLLYLKGLLNLDPDTLVTTQAIEPPHINGSSDLIPRLQHYFRRHSPLLKSLHSGIAALEQKAELEKRKRYPDLFVALGSGYGTAPNRDKQENAFITDDYNYQRIGGALGLTWDLNFQASEAKVQKAFIEYRQLATKRELTLRAQDATIAQLYGEAVRNKGLLAAAGKSLKSATTLLRLESDNRDLGLGGDTRGLISAYQQYFKLKGDVISTRYMYLVSLAELANTTGDMNLFLQWVDNGNVQL